MTISADRWEDLGDGRVQVFTRTPGGNDISVVVGRHKLGTVDLSAMLARAAEEADARARALASRVGRTDQD